MKHERSYRNMIRTGRVNGILIAILFSITFIESVLGEHALWVSVIGGIASAAIAIAGALWAVRCWRVHL